MILSKWSMSTLWSMSTSWSMSLLLLMCSQLICGQYEVLRADPFAVLRVSLKTHQAAACDNHLLGLHCPKSTRISIDYVFYGRRMDTPDDLCPFLAANKTSSECVLPNALKVVEARCQGRQRCAILAHPHTFGQAINSDPCNSTRKYVETAYKCQPSKFRSKSTCRGDTLHLRCNRRDRVIIYSAKFVEAGAAVSVYCPSFSLNEHKEDKKECKDVSKAVAKRCHHKKECSMMVGKEELEGCEHVGNHVYLKTIYACTDHRVIQRHLTEVDDEVRDRQGEVGNNKVNMDKGYKKEEKNNNENEAIIVNDDKMMNMDKLASNDSALAKDLLASYTDSALKNESRLLLMSLGLAALMAVLGVACLLVVASARRSRSSDTLARATSTPRLDLDDVILDDVRSESGSSSPASSRLSSFSPALIPLAARYTPPAPFNDDFDNNNNEDDISNAGQNVRYCTIGRVPHVPRASWQEGDAT